MVRAGLMLTGAIALLLLAMAVKGMLIALPTPPAAGGAGFDANRAAARLQRILGDERPHPVDSAANDAVRARLIAEMRSVGLEPRVTDDFACNDFVRRRTVSCARVRNVIATIGPDEGQHLLLSAHYDSTFAGPGAADAGIGVATLLETAALLRGQALARPVTFLFNEGEEMGLIGARAFLERDPLRERVDTLINLEARGVTGPAIMFETSQPNAAAIALYRAAAERPAANSLTTDLYGLIPNSTDVTVFRAAPWTILNFAIIGNETRYHSAGDDMAALDRRSLQHMGEQTLAATRIVAAGAAPAAEGQRIYTDVLGRFLVTLPMLFGFVLLGLVLLFFLITGWRRGALGRPLLAMIATLAGATALAWLGQFLLGLLRDGDYWRAFPWVTGLAVYACAITAALLALKLIARDGERTRLRAAFWLLFTLLGALLCVVAPGAAIFFLAPPLAAALGMAAMLWSPHAERIGAWAAIGLLYLTFGPALALFEELMNGGPHWTFAPLGAIILLPALIERKPLIALIRPVFIWGGAGDLFLIGWGAVALTPAYSADRQQQFAIEYVWDAEGRSGRWAVNNDGAAVPLAVEWERTELPYSTRRRWVTAAPALPVQAPGITVIGTQHGGEQRRVRLRLATNGAEAVTLIAPRETRASFVFGDDERMGAGPEERAIWRCIGRSCDGATVDVVVTRADPVELIVVGSRSGLPAEASPLVAARPANARPQYGADSTIAIDRLRL
ncbi:MAG: M20/M25/M40 family metallo-hydrolase [Sphingosinicella sp.]|uniref:M20/M25/M40 family metallo-hydrolase n=1 Tax=Sphingosinicella sp. TaxID=1917971 RepID=UPI004037F52E